MEQQAPETSVTRKSANNGGTPDILVTAIMAAYNEEKNIARSVGSLLNQTLENIEVIVVDDGSIDGTRRILDSMQDPRLRVLTTQRAGQAGALAMACREARGWLISNLDADDFALPNKFEKQANFMLSHPECAWLGCGEERVDEASGETVRRLYPTGDAEIRRQSAKCIPFCHSGVMFRKSLINEGINYDAKQPYIIDFEFFIRVAEKHRVGNYPEELVRRKISAKTFYQANFSKTQQNKRLAQLCTKAVRKFDLPFWYHAFPVARRIYHLIPNRSKTIVRRTLGLRERRV